MQIFLELFFYLLLEIIYKILNLGGSYMRKWIMGKFTHVMLKCIQFISTDNRTMVLIFCELSHLVGNNVIVHVTAL